MRALRDGRRNAAFSLWTVSTWGAHHDAGVGTIAVVLDLMAPTLDESGTAPTCLADTGPRTGTYHGGSRALALREPYCGSAGLAAGARSALVYAASATAF